MRIRNIIIAGVALLATATPAQAIEPQEFMGHVHNWMAQKGFPVGNPSLHLLESEESAKADWANQEGPLPKAASEPNRVYFYTESANLLRKLSWRYGKRGYLGFQLIDTINTAIHEDLHQLSNLDWEIKDKREKLVLGIKMMHWEEGIVDAVACDLTPHFVRELFGHVVKVEDVMDTYDEIKQVRQLSVFGSKDKKWTGRKATAWRAKLVKANWDKREVMLEKAYSARIKWGKNAR